MCTYHEVLFHREVLEDAAALNDLEDPPLGDLLRFQPVDTFPEELDTPVRDFAVLVLEKTRDRLERRTLARSVGSKQGDDPTGRHLDALFELGYRNLMGLDLSSDLLQVAGENSPHITFIRGDMRNLPFSEHFHLVLSLFTSFGYFFDDMENLQVLKEIYRCLRPGGKFLIDYINRSYLEENLVPEDIFCINGKKIISKRYFSSDKLRVEKDILVIEGQDRKTYHESVRLFTVAELKNLMEKSGFINIDCHGGLKEDTLPLNSRITLIGKIPAF